MMFDVSLAALRPWAFRKSPAVLGVNDAGIDSHRHLRFCRNIGRSRLTASIKVGSKRVGNYGDFKFDRLDENSGRYTIEMSAKGRIKKQSRPISR
jgi:hypothetical protein